MKLKPARHRLLQGIGAAVVATLIAFTGLASADAYTSPSGGCGFNGGTPIMWRTASTLEGVTAARYSRSSGEIMWDRMPGAVEYQITRDGVSLGEHDVLSWYMTDLEQGCSYDFRITALDRYENVLGTSYVRLGLHNSSFY